MVVVVMVVMLMILDEKSGNTIGVGIGNGHGRRLHRYKEEAAERKGSRREMAEAESLLWNLEISYLASGSRLQNSGIFTSYVVRNSGGPLRSTHINYWWRLLQFTILLSIVLNFCEHVTLVLIPIFFNHNLLYNKFFLLL